MSELKECPFCGHDQMMILYVGPFATPYVECCNCSANGPRGYDEKEAIELWNRRPSIWENAFTPGKTWVIGPDTGKGVDGKKITEELWKKLEEYERGRRND